VTTRQPRHTMTLDDLRDSDVVISPLMALLLGIRQDDPRVVAPERGHG